MPLPVDSPATLVPFTPAAMRTVVVFGVEVELALVPDRARRPLRATADRPAFRRSHAERIVHDEAFWRGNGLVLTPNRYPFAAGQRLLWPEARTREVPPAMWNALGVWVVRTRGSALLNTIGAAATIARAHAHLVPARQPFLPQLPERPCELDLIDLPAGVTLWQKDVPFWLLGVRGELGRCGDALVRLAEARLSAAWNVVVVDDTAWVLPRSVETPAPHFPYALGAAELWGRWCYVDADLFAAARGQDLEQALARAGMPARA